MADTFSKKEKNKKKAQKKQEKAEKREERKANNNKGKSFEDMIAYVDENGNLSDTPPDMQKRKKIDPQNIQLGAAPIEPEDPRRTGTVSFFSDKGYGFIVDDATRENIFVHTNQLRQPVVEKDKVSFERERTPKGYSAINVVKINS